MSDFNPFTSDLNDNVTGHDDALPTSESRLRAIFQQVLDNTNAAIYVKDLDGRLIVANRELAKIYGLSVEDLLGKTSREIVDDPQAAEAHSANDWHVLETGESITAEETVPGSQGTRVFLSLKFPVRDAEGRIYGMGGVSSDITVRKQAEQALRKSEELFSKVFESSPVAMGITTPEGVNVQANRALLRLLGYGPDELIGRNVNDLNIWVDPDVRRRIAELILAGQPVRNIETQWRARSGQLLDVLVSVESIILQGKPNLLGIGVDITESKRAEETLRLSEDKFSKVFHGSAAAMSVSRLRDGLILDVNKRWLDLFGYTREEAIGKIVAHRSWQSLEEREQMVRALEKDGGFYDWELQWRRTNGETRFTITSAQVTTLQDEQYIITSSVDITTRKQAEQELALALAREQQARAEAEANANRLARLQAITALLSEAGDPAESTEENTCEQVLALVLRESNGPLGAARSVLGLRDGRRLALAFSSGELPRELRSAWENYPLDAASPLNEAIRTVRPVLSDENGVWRERYPQLVPIAAQMRSESFAVFPLVAPTGTIGAVAWAFSEARTFERADIEFMKNVARQCALAIERVRLYERERQARAEAESAVQVRDKFISVASHELKTPLTTIKGYSELLVQRGAQAHLDESFQRMLITINAQTGRLEKMISGLLDISRIERGQLSLEYGPVDLQALLQSIVQDVRPTLRKHRLEFRSTGEALVTKGDESRLEQVLQNLIQNAIKYSPTGGSISVELVRQNGTAQIAITDQGIGIPADELPRLFTRFHRARNAEANHINGLGVGLYVVREIVHLHGGDITVHSVEGQGSTFTVTLPLTPKS